jgi:hypothetical protein
MLYMIVYRMESSLFFSCSCKKRTKRSRHRGGVVCLAPAIQATRPYVPHPAASPQAPEHLNLNPVQAENVPIFCLKGSASENGWAEIGTFPPELLKSTGLAGFGGVS